jgi:hypothetical protein
LDDPFHQTKKGETNKTVTHYFDKATLNTNPTHLLNFLKSSTKKIFMTKFGQIVAKYDPNLAKFGHTDLSGP